MYDLLGIEKKHSNPPELIERTINRIGTSQEGQVNKGNRAFLFQKYRIFN